MKYRVQSFNGYKFVTRGRSKPFSQEEMTDFVTGQPVKETQVKQEDTESPAWRIPDVKSRKVIFMKDLSVGIEFCMDKYGVSKEEILYEADRIAPYRNVQ